MTSLTRFLALPALGAALVLSGCDAVDSSTDTVTGDDLSDAASAIAESISLDAGGLLDDAADLAAVADPGQAKSSDLDRPGCSGDRVFDDNGTWTTTISCERGNPDGAFYAAFDRILTHRFLDADGAPQQEPQGASSLEFAIVEGTGTRRTPRYEHVLEQLGADVVVVDLDTDLVTLNGTYDRDGVNTFTGRNGGTREVDFALSLTAEDVQGPRGRGRRGVWRQAVSGTLSGVYTATVTLTSPDGDVRTRDVERTFTITFPNDGTGGRRARIAIDGQRFDADLETGEVIS